MSHEQVRRVWKSSIASYPPIDVTTLFVRVRTSSGSKRCLSSGSAIIAVQTMTTYPRTLHFRQVRLQAVFVCGRRL